ncbi:MAG: hypothetical protein ACOYJF_04975 [Prevotella sp.]|jgi:hypothetical protein
MKKIILTLMLLCTLTLQSKGQSIYKEVLRIQNGFEKTKYDTSKKLQERRVASFQWDAIEYMLYKAGNDSTFTEHQLGEQTNALMEFVQLYFKRLSENNSKSKKEIVVSRFKNASLNNSLFHDMDKDLVLAYVSNTLYTTPFSLDTDWVKALKEIRSISWD